MPNETRKVDLPLQYRVAPIESFDERTRTVNVVWTSGAREVRMDPWTGERYIEELALGGAVDMSRLQNGAPVLDMHNTERFLGLYGDQRLGIIGVVESASISDTEGRASLRFSQRAEVDPVVKDVRDGVIRNISVGYKIEAIDATQRDSKTGLPIYRATKWQPREISFVTAGVDGAAVVRSDQQRTYPCEIVENSMPKPNDANDATETTKPTPAELARMRTIRELVTRGSLPAAFATELIEGGATVAEARQRVTAELAKITEATEIRSGIVDGAGDLNNPVVRVGFMGEALAHRFGALRGELSEPARPFAYMTACELLRAQLEMFGTRTTGWPKSKIVSRYFEMLARAPAHGISDFPNLFGDVAQRSLRQGYMSYQGGLKRIARKRTAADFRTMHRIQFGEAPALLEVKPGGEITSGTIAESKEAYALATYGRIFGVTRQAVINDDLGGLTTMGEKWGRAAAEREASCFIDLISPNSGNGVTMDDGAPLFGTAHNNYSTGATTGTIEVGSVGVGVSKMRLQKGLDDTTPIDAQPAFVVVPAAKETQARQLVATITPAQTADAQPYKLDVVVDPRLDAISAAAWFLAADPNTIDTLEYAYLEGQEGVYTETRVGFEIDGMEFKARLDFACAAVDHRGLWKASGS